MTKTQGSFVATVVRKPVVRPKVIFTLVKLENGDEIQAVVFPNRVPASVKNTFINADIDQELSFNGVREINSYNNEPQIVVSDVVGGDNAQSIPEAAPKTEGNTVTITPNMTEFIHDNYKWTKSAVPESF